MCVVLDRSYWVASVPVSSHRWWRRQIREDAAGRIRTGDGMEPRAARSTQDRQGGRAGGEGVLQATGGRAPGHGRAWGPGGRPLREGGGRASALATAAYRVFTR